MDNGGLPLSYFTLEMLGNFSKNISVNQSDGMTATYPTKYFGAMMTLTLHKYIVGGLQAGTKYHFRVAATNLLGQSDWSTTSTIPTPKGMFSASLPSLFLSLTHFAESCGDGTCDIDTGETCSSCYLDCYQSCTYQQCPGTPPCNSGICENGVCMCPSGKNGPSCEFDSMLISHTKKLMIN
jgi:hypothetical protein